MERNEVQGRKGTRIAFWAPVILALVLGATWLYKGPGSTASISIDVGPVRERQDQGVINRAEPNIGEAGGGSEGPDERAVVSAVCGLIEHGKFDAASQLIDATNLQGAEANGTGKDLRLISELKDITGQWAQLQKNRELQKEAAYKEEYAKFGRLISGKRADVNDANAGSTGSPQDANDVNEPNGPTAIMAAAVRTIEFANEQQKKTLMSEPCLLAAISSAKAEAGELERKGKWLDAYIRDYSWLGALEPNNKEYTDHGEQLIDKAEIAGSFQDSPCETGKARFDGVKRRIVERAVEFLNLNYINKIDYQQMAAKGVRRCRQLAEVIGTLTQKSTGEPNVSVLGESFKDYKPDANATAELSRSLGELERETGNWPEGAGKDKFLEAFGKVLELNQGSAKLPEGLVIAEFAEAAFLALDPYTVIVWPKQVQDFEKIMTNEFSGIGIEITREKGQLTVASLLPDTPAYNSGLDAGDVIESVDGLPTKDMPIGCAVKNITGPSGTKVTLTIKHEGAQQSRQITITRAKITVPTIRGWERDGEGKWRYMIDEQNKIGYIRLTSFAEKTATDLEEALNSLESAGMRGLILDLRYDSGGFFDSAVNVTDAFLDEGLIVITRPRFGIPDYKEAHSKGTHPNYPMVVLINAGSASASEIVAGALADPSHHRATLVGERTHGKGVVQGITRFPGDGAQLKYTMAYYHLPSGQRVKSKEEVEKEGTKDWGIGPDVAEELRSDEIRKMFDIQRDNDVLVRAGHNATASPLKRHTLEQTIDADPQLETGILVIKSKMIQEKARGAKSQIPISKS